jgi:imidazolonepropionase-like amidohydrolase
LFLGVLAFWAGATMAAQDPFASTYAARPSVPTLIRDAVVLDGTGQRLDGADVLMREGRIVAVGRDLAAEDSGLVVVDAAGGWVTPGLIDVHSHLGVYASPGLLAHQDGNEATDPVTAGVWAEHGVWPQDPGFEAALAGGVTTLQVLPGSANLIGGRGVTLRVRGAGPHALHAHGQCGGLPAGVRRRRGLPQPVAEVRAAAGRIRQGQGQEDPR